MKRLTKELETEIRNCPSCACHRDLLLSEIEELRAENAEIRELAHLFNARSQEVSVNIAFVEKELKELKSEIAELKEKAKKSWFSFK